MSRRPAILTQADVARVIRAAKQEGASAIDVRPDGSIHIDLSPASTDSPKKALADKMEVVL